MNASVFLLSLLLCALSAKADDPKGAQTLMESQAPPRKPAEQKRPAVIHSKPKSEILGIPVVYGGYLTDVARAEKKRPLFNLKTPIDPIKDMENLSTYPGTDKINGVILFSIKF